MDALNTVEAGSDQALVLADRSLADCGCLAHCGCLGHRWELPPAK